VPGGRVELPTNPECFRGCSSVANNRELWILLSLQHFFDTARLRERRELLACDKFELFAQSLLCACVLVRVEQISHLNQRSNPDSAVLRL